MGEGGSGFSLFRGWGEVVWTVDCMGCCSKDFIRTDCGAGSCGLLLTSDLKEGD